ncbi:MAG: peptidylprolyl isomerase [Planctomycetes bacterium]|nr:peptidylprolyl isomerase [Planctomycetota bacterium]
MAYEKKAWAREKKLREAEAKADDLPRVKIETRYGDIVVELFENEAPNTVANFISLVEKGFYNGLTFHRVISGFMAQGGCPKGDGTGGPGYSIRGEATDEKVYRNHFRGSLSMALGDSPDSGGSQFFLTFVPTNGLDGKHTVFGRVIEGMNVLSRIQRRDPEAAAGPGDSIIKATVVRKRDHKYEPQRVN